MVPSAFQTLHDDAERCMKRAIEVEEVDKGDVSLAGPIKLVDLRDIKAFFELHPNVRSKPITDNTPNRVVRVVWKTWLVEQITAELTDITDRNCIEFPGIIPKLADTELTAKRNRGATSRSGRPGYGECIVMVERECGVDRLSGLEA